MPLNPYLIRSARTRQLQKKAWLDGTGDGEDSAAPAPYHPGLSRNRRLGAAILRVKQAMHKHGQGYQPSPPGMPPPPPGGPGMVLPPWLLPGMPPWPAYLPHPHGGPGTALPPWLLPGMPPWPAHPPSRPMITTSRGANVPPGPKPRSSRLPWK